VADGTIDTPNVHEQAVVENFEGAPTQHPRFEGRDAIREWVRDAFAPLEDGWLEVVEAVEVAPHVHVASVLMRGRMKATGLELNFPMFTLNCTQDGKLIYSKGFLDRDEALAAGRRWAEDAGR
jgi:ketosteroid isomerase-like protein